MSIVNGDAPIGLASGYGMHESSSDGTERFDQTRSCNPHQIAECLSFGACSGACSGNSETAKRLTHMRPGFARKRTQSSSFETFPPPVSYDRFDDSKPDISELQSPCEIDRTALEQPTGGRSVTSPEATVIPSQSSPEDGISPSPSTSRRTSRGQAASSQPKRLPHSIIERRYRDNLNRQLDNLRSKLPRFKESLAYAQEIEESGIPAKWPSKAVVVAAGVKYIEQIEREQRQSDARVKELEREQAESDARMRGLQNQVDGLQRLVRCDDCSVLKYLEGLQVNSNGALQV